MDSIYPYVISYQKKKKNPNLSIHIFKTTSIYILNNFSPITKVAWKVGVVLRHEFRDFESRTMKKTEDES